MTAYVEIRTADHKVRNVFKAMGEAVAPHGNLNTPLNVSDENLIHFKRSTETVPNKRIFRLDQPTGDRVFDHLTTIWERQPVNTRATGKITYTCPISGLQKEWPVNEDGKLAPLSELGF